MIVPASEEPVRRSEGSSSEFTTSWCAGEWSFDGPFWLSKHYRDRIGVADEGSPSAIVYRGKIYVFYHGAGRDGLYFFTHDGEREWGSLEHVSVHQEVRMTKYGKPAAVVFNRLLYVFYTSDDREPHTRFVVYNGAQWAGSFSVKSLLGSVQGVAKETSPAAVVFNSRLWLFWVGIKQDGIFYTSTSDALNWDHQSNVKSLVPLMGIYRGSSPAAVSFQGKLHLFWLGTGYDGWYRTTYSPEQGWNPLIDNITRQANPQFDTRLYNRFCDPSVLVGPSDSELTLLYSLGTYSWIWYVTYDDSCQRWSTPQVREHHKFGYSAASAVVFETVTYVFGTSGFGEEGMYFFKRPSAIIGEGPPAMALAHSKLAQRAGFSMVAHEPSRVRLLKDLYRSDDLFFSPPHWRLPAHQMLRRVVKRSTSAAPHDGEDWHLAMLQSLIITALGFNFKVEVWFSSTADGSRPAVAFSFRPSAPMGNDSKEMITRDRTPE